MYEAIFAFCQDCGFSAEAIGSLRKDWELLSQGSDTEKVFIQCREWLFSQANDPWPALDQLAQATGIHPFAVHQLFLVFCAGWTKVKYQERGYSKSLYWDAMKDLRHKMEETHQVYGVWGVYCGRWLAGLLRMSIFCLGRLQFEIIPSAFRFEHAGCVLRHHNPVINVHIPSFGRLEYGDVLDAYCRAAKFFSHLFPNGNVWFHCETWILYPPVNALLPEGNMKRFSRDFTVVRACIDPGQDDRYRVFMLPPSTPTTEYPENNRLQRNLKAWLLEGNTMGVGFGLFLWKEGIIS